MTHRKGAVWTERLVLALILASLGGTLNLVLSIHRRIHSTSMVSRTEKLASSSLPADAKPAAPIAPQAMPLATSPTARVELPPIPAKPPDDPTAPILGRIDAAIVGEAAAAREADRRADAMEKASRASVAESQAWKRREMLVRRQVTALSQQADKLEREGITLDAERDVLARERDALKAALGKSSELSGYAVLPYKGPNGTWRRPIVLECSGTQVKLQPNGPTFSMMDLSPLIHPRSSPVVLAIAREMMHIQQAETPDGAPAVPYLVFLVRPDGIRPYYQARSRLEPLGIAFGYELVEQDLAIEIPNFDDVRTWDGTKPLDLDLAGGDAKPRAGWPAPSAAPPGGDSRDGSDGPGGHRPAIGDPSGPGSWPPSGDSPGKPGSDRRWPDLARGDATGGGSGPSGGGSGDASMPEISLGGNPRRGNVSAGRGSADGSPDDFVWPTGAGGANPAGARRAGPGGGRASGDGSGLGDGFTGALSTGLPGPGSSSSLASTASKGDRSGYGPNGSGYGPKGPGPFSRGGGLGADSQGGAQSPGGPEAGRLVGPGGEVGRANVSTPGGGTGGGGANSGGGGGGGSGGANADSLPDLQPVGGGSSRLGTPMPGAGGSGRAGSGRSGPNPPATTGGPAADGGGGAGKPSSAVSSGQPGDGASSGGTDANDQGFTPYAAGASSPGQGAGQTAAGPTGSGSGASEPGSPGAPATIDPGSSPGSGGGQPGSETGSALTAASATAGGANPPSSSSAMISGLPTSGSNATAGTAPALASGAFAGSASASQAGTASSSSSSATGAGSPPSTTTAAGDFGGAPSRSLDSSFTSLSNAMGGSSAATSSSSASTGDASASLSGGQPSSGMPAGASGMSLPSLNVGSDPSSEPDALKELALPPIDTHRQPGAIDVPFEIVLVCRRDDLLLHPGGYRITTQSLQAGAGQGDKAEALLQRELRAIVRRRAQVDPLIRPKPRLKFLVEGGGSSTFWTARKQLTFSNLDWPMTVQVAGPQTGYLLEEGIRR